MSSVIDPSKLPASAVEASDRQQDNVSEERLRQNIAVFLSELLSDDARMKRAWDEYVRVAYKNPEVVESRLVEALRAALVKILQED